MTDFARARATMVDCQIRPNDVTDLAVLSAFLSVPREAFVGDGQQALAYSDAALPLGHGRTLLPAMVLAKMVQAMELRPGQSVLVVGGGQGYGAAIIAAMGASVVMMESDAALAAVARKALGASVIVHERDAPSASERYEAILVEGAAETSLAPLAGHLVEGGRLVGIEAPEGAAPAAVVYSRSGNGLSRRVAFNASAPVLPGFERRPAFVF